MDQEPFKVPNRAKRGGSKGDAPSRRLQLPLLPPERPVTRSAVRAWQEGSVKPWNDLPGLRLKFDSECVTSDYGTASEKSSQSFASTSSAHEACKCENMSGVGVISSDEDEGTCVNLDDLKNSLEECIYSPSNSETEDAKTENQLKPLAKLLRDDESQVMAFIPASFAKELEFAELKILCEEKYKPKLRILDRLCCPVVCLGPHGMVFSGENQVYLSLPVIVHDENLIACLCSDTGINEEPKWERLPKTSYRYSSGRVILEVPHFSLFTVILEEPYPERLKRIRKRNGGILSIEDIPGVEVNFPRGCLEDDIDAYLRVIYDTEPALLPQQLWQRYSLAAPVIMIGPHGLKFNPSRPVVTVTLPVPDLHEICRHFNIKDVLKALSVWHSPTNETEPSGWRRLKTELTLDLQHPSGLPVVSFKVQHFSFFTVFWDIVSSSLYEVKIGMAHFAHFVTFSMMCEAFMQETPNSNKFCLEVICYRSDRKLPDVSNLQHRVGAINKPKLLKPGKVLIKLRSQMFEADIDAGEEPEMCKEEPDFIGRDFEKQYACKFIADAKIDSGAFGKVLVGRSKTGGRLDLNFEFNLYKKGNESEMSYSNNGERWTIVAIKELADHLQVTDENHWKKFAQHVGFNKNEIKTKLQTSGDPFLAMINNYTQRGGSPEEFVQALFSVSRDISLNKFSNVTPPSSSTGSVSPTNSASGSNPNQNGSPFHKFVNYWHSGSKRPRREDESQDDEDEEMQPPPPKKSSKQQSSTHKVSYSSSTKNSSKKSKSGSSKKKKRVSTSSSSASEQESDADDGPVASVKSSSNQYRSNSKLMGDTDLWKVSEVLSNNQWRVLGRNLGLDESAITNIDQSFKGMGTRECAYQVLLEWKSLKSRKCTLGTLYKSLEESKMFTAAKNIANMKYDAP